MARRNDHTREQLMELALSSAEDIIRTQGLEGLTARKVAAAMGYTVGTLYLLFENLNDLIIHVNARTLGRLSNHLEARARVRKSVEASLRDLVLAYVDFAHREQNLWITLYTHHQPEDVAFPTWYLQKVSHIFNFIEEILSAEDSGLSPGQAARLARSLWCSVHGACILSVSQKLQVAGDSSIEDTINYIINLYSSYLLQETGEAA